MTQESFDKRTHGNPELSISSHEGELLNTSGQKNAQSPLFVASRAEDLFRLFVAYSTLKRQRGEGSDI